MRWLDLRVVLPAVFLLAVACGGAHPFPTPEPYVNPEPPPEDTANPIPDPITPLPPAPPPPPPSPPGSIVDQAVVPRGMVPPVGLTLRIGMAENVNDSQLRQMYARFVGVNETMWDVTEGQVYLYRIVVTDGVGPGTTPAAWEANHALIDTHDLDCVVWPPWSWDVAPALGKVWWSGIGSFGHSGRLMLLPDNASGHTQDHEYSHLIWELSWGISFSLEDEYNDGVQDPACIMESDSTPIRWCSKTNHVTQTVQPWSCWEQIIADYPAFTHKDTEKASTAVWLPLVEFHDTP